MLILVVDDDEVSAHAARTILEEMGCQVHTAPNGAEAIGLFRANSYSLVLMDWQMPVMDGLEATAQIRGMLRGRITPIIATTTQMGRVEVLAAGMDDLMPKPFTPENLRAIVAKWIG
jgi:CheY-like chemotaxis protein